MFCPKCGKQNENTNFCVSCGAQLPKPKTAVSAVANTNKEVAAQPQPAVNPKPVTTIQNQPVFNRTQASPVIKPAKPAAPSEPVFTKENILKWSFIAILAVLYILISLFFVLSFGMKKQILITSAFNESFKASMTLETFLNLLIKGNRVFNPTVISTTLGVLTKTLFCSVPVFALLAFATSFTKKGKIFNIISSVVSSLSALFMALIVPICVNFVPDFKVAISAKAGILAEDITSVTFTTFIIHAVAALLFVAATIVISSILNKRRKQK